MPTRVVLVHGFTQSAASWDPLVAHLPPEVEVHRPELPGHGAGAALRWGFVETADELARAAGDAVYCGYSLGGRLCLRLALDHPEVVHGLVLIGASPGLDDDGARAQRRVADERLADEIERDGVDAFLERWLAQPLLAGTPLTPGERAARAANPAAGLAHALRALGTGAMEPLWDRLAALRPPTLLVVGAGDAKFRSVAERMAAAIGPRARVEVVAGAGHSVPLDQPAAAARLVHAHAAAHAW